MAKRKYSDIEDQYLEEYHHPSKALRLFTPSLEKVDHHNRPYFAKTATFKPRRKKNRFDVDSLLAEKTKEIEDDEEERPSPTVTPIFHHANTKSAFQRLYRKKEDFLYTATKEYSDMTYKCTKPCCALLRSDEQLSYGRYPSSIDLYRSKESRSTDSAESSCNSYEHLSADYKRYLLNRRHRDFIYDEKLYGVEKLQFPYEYHRRPEDVCFLRKSRHSCSCMDCHSSSKELYYCSRRAVVEPIKRNVNVIYTRDKDYEQKSTVSKKRALIDEPEKSDDHQIAQRELKKKTPTEIKQEIEKVEDDESEELDVVEIHHVDKKKKKTLENKSTVKQKMEDETTNELLKMPAVPGQSRNRAVANLLERRRVAELNTAFERLRVLIPSYGNEDRALSKIKTLKYALTYMTHLMAVLRKQSDDSDFEKLSQQDPLFQKCREHMVVRKIF